MQYSCNSFSFVKPINETYTNKFKFKKTNLKKSIVSVRHAFINKAIQQALGK